MAVVRRSRLTALVLLGVLIVGCSSTGATGSPVATDRVDLPPSYRFAPAAITVSAGATVTWTNDDHFTHSVQITSGGLPADPHVMEPGQSTTVTFATPGTYTYQCHLHPQNMKGSVAVTP